MARQKQEPAEQEPRKPGRPEQRTTLAPLEFEEALRDLMATGQPAADDDKDDKG